MKDAAVGMEVHEDREIVLNNDIDFLYLNSSKTTHDMSPESWQTDHK